MDKNSERGYKYQMINRFQRLSALKPFFLSALFLSFSLVAALYLGVFHVASASQGEKPSLATVKKPGFADQPIAFARYTKADSFAVSQTIEETLNCRQSAAFQGADAPSVLSANIDFCAPLPSLTTSNEDAHKSVPKWLLPKSPIEFIWQQDVAATQKLTVELLDSDGLPWPAIFKTSKRGAKESVQIVPNYELLAKREMFLVANLYGPENQRIENWVLSVAVERGAETSLPWNSKK